LLPEPLQTSRRADSTAKVVELSAPNEEAGNLELRNSAVTLAARRAVAEWDEFVASGATRHFRGSPVGAGSPTPPEQCDSMRLAGRATSKELER